MQIGQFQTTLYADHAYLSFFYISLISLENRLNMELITIGCVKKVVIKLCKIQLQP